VTPYIQGDKEIHNTGQCDDMSVNETYTDMRVCIKKISDDGVSGTHHRQFSRIEGKAAGAGSSVPSIVEIDSDECHSSLKILELMALFDNVITSVTIVTVTVWQSCYGVTSIRNRMCQNPGSRILGATRNSPFPGNVRMSEIPNFGDTPKFPVSRGCQNVRFHRFPDPPKKHPKNTPFWDPQK
jgi:hypothetical protein